MLFSPNVVDTYINCRTIRFFTWNEIGSKFKIQSKYNPQMTVVHKSWIKYSIFNYFTLQVFARTRVIGKNVYIKYLRVLFGGEEVHLYQGKFIRVSQLFFRIELRMQPVRLATDATRCENGNECNKILGNGCKKFIYLSYWMKQSIASVTLKS